MNVLVVNIGSTSFKFRLFDMRTEKELARGGAEGVGAAETRVYVEGGAAPALEIRRRVANQDEAVRTCMAALQERGDWAIDAVGFKAVHGGNIAAPVRVNDEVLATMQAFADACPAHNPPYIAAMKAFATQRPDTPLVAAFETGFHQSIPSARQTYAIPYSWTTDFGVRRYGFHGASHAFVAQRVADLLDRRDLRIISCHLGGSSSISAIAAGQSVANSFGMAAQSGLPHNNRVGDFDAYALPLLARRTGRTIEELLAVLSKEGGLLGVSGISNDMRAILQAAQEGHARAALARDMFVESIRHYVGAYLVALQGLDVLVFTGGIGERAPEIRARVCAGLQFLGISLDVQRNAAPSPDGVVSAEGGAVRILVLATNEELVVARQTVAVLTGRRAGALSGSN
jgi:acetate kinase